MATLLATVTVAGVLSGCAQSDGTALARQACTKVTRSIALYRSSLTETDPKVAGEQQSQAMAQLRDALPTAATAAGEDGQYQALMATLGESDDLPESLLIHALTAQCAAADSANGAGTGTGTGPGPATPPLPSTSSTATTSPAGSSTTGPSPPSTAGHPSSTTGGSSPSSSSDTTAPSPAPTTAPARS